MHEPRKAYSTTTSIAARPTTLCIHSVKHIASKGICVLLPLSDSISLLSSLTKHYPLLQQSLHYKLRRTMPNKIQQKINLMARMPTSQSDSFQDKNASQAQQPHSNRVTSSAAARVSHTAGLPFRTAGLTAKPLTTHVALSLQQLVDLTAAVCMVRKHPRPPVPGKQVEEGQIPHLGSAFQLDVHTVPIDPPAMWPVVGAQLPRACGK